MTTIDGLVFFAIISVSPSLALIANGSEREKQRKAKYLPMVHLRDNSYQKEISNLN
jgi:hypothetical protein